MVQDGTLSVIWLIDDMRDQEVIALREVRAALSAVCSRYEIVLVTHDVPRLVEHFAGADPYVKIIKPDRRGDGAALTAGCGIVTGDYVLVILGSMVPDWEALPLLVPFLERSDVVTAFSVSGSVAPSRNVFVLPALGFLFGVVLRDPFNPAKLYRAELLRGVSFVSSGPALHIELMAKAQAQGAIVTEVGVSVPQHTNAAPALQWAKEAGRLWLHLRRFRPDWTVRARPVMHAPSEYVAGGLLCAIVVWFVRGWFARSQ